MREVVVVIGRHCDYCMGRTIGPLGKASSGSSDSHDESEDEGRGDGARREMCRTEVSLSPSWHAEARKSNAAQQFREHFAEEKVMARRVRRRLRSPFAAWRVEGWRRGQQPQAGLAAFAPSLQGRICPPANSGRYRVVTSRHRLQHPCRDLCPRRLRIITLLAQWLHGSVGKP